MKKIGQLWLLSFMTVFLLAACGGTTVENKPQADDAPKEEVVEAAFPLTLTDAIGNELTLEAAPKTIVSMTPSNTEILFALGLENAVIGVNDYDNYPKAVLEKEKIGGIQFDVEKIVSMNPEMVFAHESGLSTGAEGLQQLRDAGIPVFVVTNAANFEETYATIMTIGQATDKADEASEIVANMKAKVEEVLAKIATVENKRTVFVETSPAPTIYTPGKNTFMDQMLGMIGAENISADREDWFVMDPEEIVHRNPDVIVVMYERPITAIEDVSARDGFDAITAVKERRIVQVDENKTSRTGPRLAEGLEEIAKAVYPEAFNE